MRVQPTATWDATDATWTIQGGATTREVLEAEAWHSYQFWQSRDLGLADPESMARWCAPYVCAIDPDDGSRLEDPGWSAVERFLPQPKLWALKEKIIELSMYEDDVLEQAYEYWKVELDGGCDCPICKGHVSRSEATHPVRQACRVPMDANDQVIHIAQLYSGLEDETLLDEPWWLYQLHCAFRRARADLMEENEEDQEKAEKAQELTRQHGIA